MKKPTSWLILVLLVGLIAAATAYALSTNNVRWKVNGAALTSGQTRSVTSSAMLSQTMKSGGIEIQCSNLTGSVGMALLGSNSPNPGTAEGKLTYSGCTVLKFEKCKINGARPGSFETKPLLIELVYLSRAGAEEEKIANGINAMLVKPKEGTTVAEFSLSPTSECPSGTSTVTIGGEAGKTGILFKALETTANEELETHEIEAPETAIKNYFTNTGGSTEEHTGEGIKANSNAATYQGRVRVSVGSGNKYNLVLP